MSKRVLIIDDDQAICQVLSQAYSEIFTIKTSPSPENIFILLDGFNPDVILIEYKLKKLNGAKLCTIIKLNPETTKTPVIVLSTITASNEEIKNCFCDHFIEKPFDLWELENIIKKC